MLLSLYSSGAGGIRTHRQLGCNQLMRLARLSVCRPGNPGPLTLTDSCSTTAPIEKIAASLAPGYDNHYDRVRSSLSPPSPFLPARLMVAISIGPGFCLVSSTTSGCVVVWVVSAPSRYLRSLSQESNLGLRRIDDGALPLRGHTPLCVRVWLRSIELLSVYFGSPVDLSVSTGLDW